MYIAPAGRKARLRVHSHKQQGMVSLGRSTMRSSRRSELGSLLHRAIIRRPRRRDRMLGNRGGATPFCRDQQSASLFVCGGAQDPSTEHWKPPAQSMASVLLVHLGLHTPSVVMLSNQPMFVKLERQYRTLKHLDPPHPDAEHGVSPLALRIILSGPSRLISGRCSINLSMEPISLLKSSCLRFMAGLLILHESFSSGMGLSCQSAWCS